MEALSHVYSPGTPLEKKALSGVSLQIMPGECWGILGETGSGKTTLVQHFNGLLKPSAGKVYVEGKDLSSGEVSLPEIRRRVALAFQFPEHQLFEETVSADISFVLRQKSVSSSQEIESLVKSACRMVGLDYEAFACRSPFELSGGEMRRVALAGILAQDPPVLILDEPTAGLDGKGREEILREIGEIRRSGRTVIMISHSVEDLAELADRLLVLEEGRILAVGAPADVFSFLLRADKVTFLVPPVFRLLEELRGLNCSIPGGIYRMEEAVAALNRFLSPPTLNIPAEN